MIHQDTKTRKEPPVLKERTREEERNASYGIITTNREFKVCASDEDIANDTTAVENAPVGYPQLAVFQSSDPSFLQFRGFSTLHCRILSSLQYDVECLEQELAELDECDKNDKGELKLTNKSRDES